MPQQSVDYTFNASALGLGGHYILGGRRVVVPSVASVALAPTGGEGSAVVGNFDNGAGISFLSAKSLVSGLETQPGVFSTHSEIEIRGLSIFNRVFIDQLNAVVSSERDTRNLPDGTDEATFHVEATYDNVMIDGCLVQPQIDGDACKASYAAHHKAFTRHAAPGAHAAAPSLERGDPIRRSVVTGLPIQQRTNVVFGKEDSYILNVPGLGRIHFGELLVKRGRRRVNLLRFEFQTSAITEQTGMLAVGSGDGNGEPIWPRK